MIHVFDTHQLDFPGIVAATALETRGGMALFDTGPESTFDRVKAELRRIGAAPRDVRHVFLSHIHLDHAGAAWRFAETGATIYVHARGATHLLDPTRLIDSATRIFGDDMPRLWGRIAAVPRERVRVVEDGEVIDLGSAKIRALETPGHASHHHVYHWDNNLFGGDIAGVRIGDGPPVPPFVPPELHVETWHDSIAKMRRLAAENLYLPHFGKIEGTVADHLDALDERVRDWSHWLRDRISAGVPEDDLKREFARYEAHDLRGGGASEQEIAGYEAADPSYMAVLAAIRYWKKFHQIG